MTVPIPVRDTGAATVPPDRASVPVDHRVGVHRDGRTPTDYSVLLETIRSMGLLDRRYGYYAVRGALLTLALIGVTAAAVAVGDSWWQVGLAVVLAVVLTQVIFLGHDAAHRQIFASARANEITALILAAGLSGMSLAWWNSKHARHHGAPNQIGRDPDITPSVVHFYPPEQPPTGAAGRWLHERQGWWFFPLLVVEALNLQVQSVLTVITTPGLRHRGTEATVLVVRLVGLPVVLFTTLSPGVAATFLVVQMTVTGVYLGSVFAPAHIGMPILGPEARMDFFRRQVLISRNIQGGRFLTFLMGGLNHQVEHHLFPNMPRPHLARARAVVQAFCADRRVTYTEKPLPEAWGLVIRYLNTVGLAARDPFACPAARLLR